MNVKQTTIILFVCVELLQAQQDSVSIVPANNQDSINIESLENLPVQDTIMVRDTGNIQTKIVLKVRILPDKSTMTQEEVMWFLVNHDDIPFDSLMGNIESIPIQRQRVVLEEDNTAAIANNYGYGMPRIAEGHYKVSQLQNSYLRLRNIVGKETFESNELIVVKLFWAADMNGDWMITMKSTMDLRVTISKMIQSKQTGRQMLDDTIGYFKKSPPFNEGVREVLGVKNDVGIAVIAGVTKTTFTLKALITSHYGVYQKKHPNDDIEASWRSLVLAIDINRDHILTATEINLWIRSLRGDQSAVDIIEEKKTAIVSGMENAQREETGLPEGYRFEGVNASDAFLVIVNHCFEVLKLPQTDSLLILKVRAFVAENVDDGDRTITKSEINRAEQRFYNGFYDVHIKELLKKDE